MSDQSNKPRRRWVLLIWVSAITLSADGMLLWAIARQIYALTYPSTNGVVTASNYEVDDWQFDLEYQFRVADQAFTGKRLRYGPVGDSDAIIKATKEFPVGKEVTVFYRASDPSDCLLRRGLSGFDFFMLIFLTPFNAIMIGLWVARPQWLASHQDRD